MLAWDEFIALGEKINQASSSRIFPVPGLSWQVVFESLRGEFLTKNGLPRIAGNAELRTALQMHNDMIYQHRIVPTAIELNALSGQGGWGAGSLNHFGAGHFGMIITG